MVYIFERYVENCWVDRVNEKLCRSGNNQGHRGHINVKCESNQVLVMINLYVKLNVHSSINRKQVITLKVTA